MKKIFLPENNEIAKLKRPWSETGVQLTQMRVCLMLAVEKRLTSVLWKTRFEDQRFTSLHYYMISGNDYIIYWFFYRASNKHISLYLLSPCLRLQGLLWSIWETIW